MFPIYLMTLGTLSWMGCEEEQAAPETTAAAPAEEVQEEAPAEEEAASGDPATLLQQGKSSEALAILEAELQQEGAEPQWGLLARAARESDSPAEVLQRVSFPETLPAQGSRLDIALAAGDLPQAMSAANALHAKDPRQGNLARARALIAGAEAGELSLSAEEPGAKLAEAAQAQGGVRRMRLASIGEVKGWEAQIILAQLQASIGEADSAENLLLLALSEGGEPAALRVPLPLLERLQGSKDGTEIAEKVARQSSSSGMGSRAGSALGLAAEGLERQHKHQAAFALADGVHAERKEAGDQTGSSMSALALARSSMRVGEVERALQVSRTAAASFQEAGKAPLAARAALLQLRAAWALGMDEDISSAVALLGSDHKTWAEGLLQITLGRPAEGLKTLQAAPGDKPAWLLLAQARAAFLSGGDPAPSLDAALRAAGDDRMTQVEVHLTAHQYASAQAASGAGSLRALEAIAGQLGESGAALRTEIAARKIMSGEAAVLPPKLPVSAVWRQLQGKGDSAEETDHPIALWAKARVLAQQDSGELVEAYRQAVLATPVHRQGPWAPISVLDGSAGPGMLKDIQLLKASAHPAAPMAALHVHDAWKAAEIAQAAWEIGDDPSLSLELASRSALQGGYYRHRQQSLLWLSGGGEAPLASGKQLKELEAQAMEVEAYSRAFPPLGLELLDGVKDLSKQVLLSFRLGARTGEVIVHLGDRSWIEDIPKAGAIRKDLVRYRKLLEKQSTPAEAKKDGKVMGELGDSLRSRLLDSVTPAISERGIARYLVVPDRSLWVLPLDTLPEQRLAKRFLVSVRTMGFALTASQALLPLPNLQTTFENDFLGLTPVSPDGQGLLEVQDAGRISGSGLRVMLLGEEASKEGFLKAAESSRYIHITDVLTGDRGGLKMREELVSLAELRALNLQHQAAVLSAEMQPAVMLRRMLAFERATTGDLILGTWLSTQRIRGRILHSFYQKMGLGEVSAAVRFAQARQTLFKDEPSLTSPGLWGEYFFFGQP